MRGQLVLPASELLARLIVALLAGMLIGLEREKARATAARRKGAVASPEEMVIKEFPGLRTFSVTALYGALTGIAVSSGDRLAGAVLVAGFAALVVTYAIHRLIVARSGGITTLVVLLADFAIGFTSGLGYTLAAAAAAVLAAFVLALKIPVEEVLGRIRYEEILWALELAVVLLVVGPFFLTSNITLLGVPVKGLYLFFALVLATSYAAYVALRLRGISGLAYVALLGGLASSEAALVSCLEVLPEEERPKLAPHVAAIANMAMLGRNVGIALIAAYFLAGRPPLDDARLLVPAALLAALPAVAAWRRLSKWSGEVQVPMRNPLSFGTALKLTLLYIGLSLALYAASLLGSRVAALLVFLGGFIAASATILSVYTVYAPMEPSRAALMAATVLIAGLLNKPLYVYLATGDRVAAEKTLAASIVQCILLIVGLTLAYKLPI